MQLTEWRSYVASVVASPPARMRPAIVQSWKRSHAAAVNPCSEAEFGRRVPMEELVRRVTNNHLLVGAARRELPALSEVFKDVPHVTYITDADAIILFSVGNEFDPLSCRLSPGFDWSENAVGTNGAGTAIASGRPVAVIGADHYCYACRNWTCLGAPIIVDGKIIGAVDFSTDIRHSQPEQLSLIVQVARQIASNTQRAVSQDAAAH